MQTDYKQIYKKAAEKHQGNEQLYKDLGNFVFQELYKQLRRPPSLIIRLRGVGKWVLRRKRMKYIVENHPPADSPAYTDELSLYKYENKKEIHKIFIERLKEYEEYVKQRDAIRKIRYATQTLLEPPDGESERFRSS